PSRARARGLTAQASCRRCRASPSLDSRRPEALSFPRPDSIAFFGGADMSGSRYPWSPNSLGVLFGLLALVPLRADAALPRRFPERFQFDAGHSIQRIAFGDINGDGRLDALAQTATD